MSRIWESPAEARRTAQGGPVRELLIGHYAAHEQRVIHAMLRCLEVERRLPLRLAHRLVDRLASMTVGTTVLTYEEIVEVVKALPDDFVIAKGPCACRVHTADSQGPDGRDLKAGRLDLHKQTPLNVDIQIGKCGEKFAELETYERISKVELLELEEQCHNLGLVPNIYVALGGEASICHCSSATCAPMMANEALGGTSTVLRRGKYIAKTDRKRCCVSGDCVEVCHFKARAITQRRGEGILVFRAEHCYGCGLCADVCPERAVSMVERARREVAAG